MFATEELVLDVDFQLLDTQGLWVLPFDPGVTLL